MYMDVKYLNFSFLYYFLLLYFLSVVDFSTLLQATNMFDWHLHLAKMGASNIFVQLRTYYIIQIIFIVIILISRLLLD